MNKKDIRKKFREDVFKRDKYTCKVCGFRNESNPYHFNAHHIINRSLMPLGGYVKENGITVCEEVCHMKCERYHITNGKEHEDGLSPDDLYKIIGSSKEIAIEKSKLLSSQ